MKKKAGFPLEMYERFIRDEAIAIMEVMRMAEEMDIFSGMDQCQ